MISIVDVMISIVDVMISIVDVMISIVDVMISIVFYGKYIDYLSLSRPLLHAVQPPRNHGQKPSNMMYRVI